MNWRTSSWMDAHELHARIGKGGWAPILERLGIPPEALRSRKQQPCPLCGGVDRYCYDDKFGRGDYICRKCGNGDALDLLEGFHRWTFRQAFETACEAAGIGHRAESAPAASKPPRAVVHLADQPASPTRRVRELLRTSCDPAGVADVRNYLDSRGLWPLPLDCTLRAHASAEYWDGKNLIGRYAAILTPVVDVGGQLVTCHVTYLREGKKLEGHPSRKILSPMTGRTGCAARLMPGGTTLGICEGVETGLAAYKLSAELYPIWAALNAGALAKFEPPPGIKNLAIHADRDVAGLEAATTLMERLQGRVDMALALPPAPHKDWCDALIARLAS